MRTLHLSPRGRWQLLALLCGALCCPACGNSNQKTVYPAKGSVYVQSKPAVGALVVLQPAGDKNPEEWSSGFPRGIAGEDGTFRVSTYGENDGAPAGDYVVLVSWPQAQPGSRPNDPEAPTVDRLEGRYMDPDKSTLRAKIEEKSNELPQFDLR